MSGASTLRGRVARSVATAVLAGTGALAVFACAGSRAEGLDASKLPEEIRGDYDVFARRCSKCHSLARPLTSGITDDAQWGMYVNRMRRQPGSGISYEDQDRILRFLRFYAADLRQKEAERKAPPPPPSPVLDASAATSIDPGASDVAPAPTMKGDGG